MWDLIVSVPDHCLSFYFSYVCIPNSFRLCSFEMIEPKTLPPPLARFSAFRLKFT